MLMTSERRPAIRTMRGWAIDVLQNAGAIRECEEHGWMQDRADPHEDADTRRADLLQLEQIASGYPSRAGLGVISAENVVHQRWRADLSRAGQAIRRGAKRRA